MVRKLLLNNVHHNKSQLQKELVLWLLNHTKFTSNKYVVNCQPKMYLSFPLAYLY